MPEVTAGVDTSEKKVADGASVWGSVATILGVVLSVGSTLLPSLGDGSKLGIIAGAIIALAGIVQKTLVSLGYIKSRTEVKAAASYASGRND